MLHHLHPVNHVKEAWSNSSTISAKTSVALFYVWFYLMLLFSVFGIFWPRRFLHICTFEGFDDFTTYIMITFMREFFVLFIGFILYVEWHGVHSTCNLAVLSAVLVIICLLDGGPWTRAAIDAMTDKTTPHIGDDCWTAAKWGYSFMAGIPVLTLFFRVIDWWQTRRSGTSAEHQPLTS